MSEAATLAKIEVLLGTTELPRKLLAEMIFHLVASTVRKAGGRPTGTADNSAAARQVNEEAENLQLSTPNASTSHQIDVSETPENDASDDVSDLNSGSSLSLFSDPSKPLSLRNRRSNEPLPAGFAEFWALPVRRVCKQAAVETWKKAAREGWLPPLEVLMTAMIWQIEAWDANGTPDDKRPHVSTWLNGRRWNDEKPQARPMPTALQKRTSENLEGMARNAEIARRFAKS